MEITLTQSHAVFGGSLRKYTIASAPSLGGLPSNFAVFIPPPQDYQESGEQKVPAVVFLSGLTCTEDNACQKGGFFGPAARRRIAFVFPDTSPRGAGIGANQSSPAGETDSWDFGVGAGFYIDATRAPYAAHYNMESFITQDLPRALQLVPGLSIDPARVALSGHSMGGHGALSLYLKHPHLFKCASAFAPICNPCAAPWGIKAFTGYLAGGVEEGRAHDVTEIIKTLRPEERKLDILIDCGEILCLFHIASHSTRRCAQGRGDQFYVQKQLLPEAFEAAARAAGYPATQVSVSLHDFYDHSYYFISSFAEAHIEWIAERV
ncbi:hypothetical protein HDU83_004152 [Entophlyctis luteolus]|nr:hypothetical protein HDU83_004152 [Entophlyctis luteolus]